MAGSDPGFDLLIQGLSAGQPRAGGVGDVRGEVLGQLLNAFGVPTVEQREAHRQQTIQGYYKDVAMGVNPFDKVAKKDMVANGMPPLEADALEGIVGGDAFKAHQDMLARTRDLADRVSAVQQTHGAAIDNWLQQLSGNQTPAALPPAQSPAEGTPRTPSEFLQTTAALPAEMTGAVYGPEYGRLAGERQAQQAATGRAQAEIGLRTKEMASREKLTGAEIASREKIAANQIAAQAADRAAQRDIEDQRNYSSTLLSVYNKGGVPMDQAREIADFIHNKGKGPISPEALQAMQLSPEDAALWKDQLSSVRAQLDTNESNRTKELSTIEKEFRNRGWGAKILDKYTGTTGTAEQQRQAAIGDTNARFDANRDRLNAQLQTLIHPPGSPTREAVSKALNVGTAPAAATGQPTKIRKKGTNLVYGLLPGHPMPEGYEAAQ